MMLFLRCLLQHPARLMCAALLSVSAGFAQAADTNVSALEMVVLGSGGPGATGRAGAGYALLLDGKPRILVDAGPGTFVRMGEAKLDIRGLDIVLLTHLHVDHVGELPGIIKARAVSSRTDIHFQVFGPGGSNADTDDDGKPAAHFPSTRHYIDLLFGSDGAFSYLQDFAGTVKFDTTDLFVSRAMDGDNATPQVILSQDGLVISAVKGHHRDAPSVIYRVDYKGKSITFSGDIDAHAHAALSRIAQGSELLVFNAVVLDPPNSPPILYTLHTSPSDIGKIAGAAKVSSLLLSHLSPTIDEARNAVTLSIRQHYQGDLKFAVDGMKFRL
ncbi:MBL fold metallo-hydrolase [Pseudomonas sp. NA-150]|uniref:MBL fold metallo-hydrolase n=1 Tax=Pseudomonas sp. NA-150 TaxID=3367525 RepID=UPI0037C8F1D0